MTTNPIRTCRLQRTAVFLLTSAAIVGALTMASPAPAQSPPRDADMRVLVVDLAAELRLAYRHNLPEYAHRHEQLREAIAAWNTSPKSAADRQQMSAWLREAIRNSMPGTDKPMPAAPTFESRAIVSPAAQRSVVVAKPITPTPLVEQPTARDESPAIAAESAVSVSPNPTPAIAPAIDEVNWTEHPAAGDLPAELRDGDPFRDDPSVTQ